MRNGMRHGHKGDALRNSDLLLSIPIMSARKLERFFVLKEGIQWQRPQVQSGAINVAVNFLDRGSSTNSTIALAPYIRGEKTDNVPRAIYVLLAYGKLTALLKKIERQQRKDGASS